MQQPALTGLLVVIGVLTLASALGWWWRRRDGRIRPVTGDGQPALSGSVSASTLAALGVRPGAVTLVQFSSESCAPCRATRRLLAEVEAQVGGVHVVEVDAARHLDIVRDLDIWRTPTVLMLDTTGRIVQRVSGVPGREDLIEALRPLLVRGVR